MAILGDNSSPTGFNSGNLDRVYLNQWTVSGGGFAVTALHVNVQGTGAFRLVVYASDGPSGGPGTLVCYTANLAGPGGATADVSGAPNAPTTLTDGAAYWIGLHFGDNGIGLGTNGAGKTLNYRTGATFAAGAPNPFGATPSAASIQITAWLAGTTVATSGTASKIKFGTGLTVADEGANVIRVDAGAVDITGKVDRDAVEAATNRLVAVKLAAGDAQPAFRILGDGTLQWGSGATTAPDVKLYRAAADHLRLEDLLQAVRANTADPALSAAVIGEGTARLVIAASGSLNWSGGTGSLDTDLYRAGSGQLRSSSSFASDQNITAKNGSANAAYIGDVGAVPGLALGSPADTKLYRGAADRLQTNGSVYVGAALQVQGQLRLNSVTSGAVGGAQANKLPVYDNSGTLIGYVPIYAT